MLYFISSYNIKIYKPRQDNQSMAITRSLNKNLLERLKEDNAEVRISYLGEKTSSYMGKIKDVTDHGVVLLPYLVYEPLSTPNVDKFLNRYRIETKYEKILPLAGILPEPLSKGHIDEFIKLQNYFSSLVISDKELKDKLFNKDIYLMPSEEEINILEKVLSKNDKTPKENTQASQ